MRRAELIRAIERVPGFTHPRAEWEQVVTPSEAAAEMLFSALAAGDLEGRSVVDLGCGTGRLAVGASLLGAESVTGIDQDAEAIEVARSHTPSTLCPIEWIVASAGSVTLDADTYVMNPPFGAQSAHADRPFWETALAHARRAVYAFALSDSRTFIVERSVARGAQIRSTRPVPWRLPPTFRHHRRPSVELSVDLWEIEPPGANR